MLLRSLPRLLRTVTSFLTWSLGIAISAYPSHAQCTPRWLPGDSEPGVDNNVRAIATLPSGEVVVGGIFGTAGGQITGPLARFNLETKRWSGLGTLQRMPPAGRLEVNALTVTADGDLYVGGEFGSAGGVLAANIARYRSSTGSWTAIAPIGTNNITAITAFASGDIVVGGSFTTAGFQGVAIYRTSSNSWQPLGQGPQAGVSGTVNTVLALSNGDVVVGGELTAAGGLPANNIAVYSPSTGAWTPLSAPGIGVVNAIVELPDNGWLVGFQSLSGNILARYQPMNNSWTFVPTPSSALSVTSIAKLGASDFAISGGTFYLSTFPTPASVVKFNSTTNEWSSLGVAPRDQVSTLAVHPSGVLLAGGRFTQAGAIPAGRVASFSPLLGTWSALGTGTGAGSGIFSLTPISDGSIIASGHFESVGGVAARNIARYQPESRTWTALGQGVSGFINGTLQLNNGKILAYGSFSSVLNASKKPVELFDPTTETWSSLGNILASSRGGLCAVELPQGDILLGGDLFLNSQTRDLARYSFTTGQWTVLHSVTPGSITAIKILTPTSVLVAGKFPLLASQNFALFNPETNVLSSTGARFGYASSEVYAIERLSDGSILVGGSFDPAFSAGTVPSNGIARYQPDSGTWSAVGSGVASSTTSVVAVLTPTPNGDVLVGGFFSQANGIPANNIARFRPSTGQWSALSSGVSSGVDAIVALPNGDVLAAGRFAQAGDRVSVYFARFSSDRECLADFNCTGEVNTSDIFSYLTAWFAGDLAADYDSDSTVSPLDIFIFLNAWFSPC